jgi:hypothetical protein
MNIVKEIQNGIKRTKVAHQRELAKKDRIIAKLKKDLARKRELHKGLQILHARLYSNCTHQRVKIENLEATIKAIGASMKVLSAPLGIDSRNSVDSVNTREINDV